MNHRDNEFNIPVRITYRPPITLLHYMAFTHIGAIICLCVVSLSIFLFGILSVLIIVNYFLYYQKFESEREAVPSVELCLGNSNEWTALMLVDDVMTLRLLPGALMHQLLLILRFVDENGRSFCFVLSKENFAIDILRGLRVRLLHSTPLKS